ncbi:MAG: hypothetical protein HY558_06605 [Euryarchaeota archaeon]|nr:hypothetical protein [Euryarchaeota archaeon]
MPTELTQIKGVGASTARRLAQAGYSTLQEVALARAAELAEKASIPPAAARSIINNARRAGVEKAAKGVEGVITEAEKTAHRTAREAKKAVRRTARAVEEAIEEPPIEEREGFLTELWKNLDNGEQTWELDLDQYAVETPEGPRGPTGRITIKVEVLK